MPRDALLNPPRRVNHDYPLNLALGARTQEKALGFTKRGRWARRKDKFGHPLFVIWAVLTGDANPDRDWVHAKDIADVDLRQNGLKPASTATAYRFIHKLFKAGYIEAATDGECLYARLPREKDAKWHELLRAYGFVV